MYIGLKNIQNLFSDLPNLLTASDGIHCLTGWTKLESAPHPYTNHLLYTCIYDNELDTDAFAGETEMHLLCIASPGADLAAAARRFPDTVSLLMLESDRTEPVYTILQHYFNMQCGVGMFGQTLLEYLSFDSGLQSAIEHSYGALRNPVFVFDTNYNLIAATWKAIEKLEINDPVILKKQFSDKEFKMVSRENNLHSKVRRSELPIRPTTQSWVTSRCIVPSIPKRIWDIL